MGKILLQALKTRLRIGYKKLYSKSLGLHGCVFQEKSILLRTGRVICYRPPTGSSPTGSPKGLSPKPYVLVVAIVIAQFY